MNGPFADFGKNRVSFITFNYDRVVEHFLFTALQNSYGKTDKECASQVAAIPIIHLHGAMGLLPWQQNNGTGVRAFEPVVNANTVEVAMGGIKIIHEALDSSRDKDFQSAKELLAKAVRVYFLGFGFGETNSERLGLRALPNNVMYATGYQLTDHERNRLRQRSNPHIEISSWDCINLLRHRGEW
jgi:hypothetical protein